MLSGGSMSQQTNYFRDSKSKPFSLRMILISIVLMSVMAVCSLPSFATDAVVQGDGSALRLNHPIVGMAATPSGGGYWMVASDGGIFSFGDAQFYGGMGGRRLNQPIVGMAATPSGHGYWMVASDGGIFSFGDAQFYGGMGGQRLNQPIVGMTSSASGRGYWMVASDGGIFSFGDAQFYGSTGGMRLNKPIVGMTASGSGRGYWFVASDGGIFSFGDAQFYGSTGGIKLVSPVTGMVRSTHGNGYWLVAADGGIFSFGSAQYFGSIGGGCLGPQIKAIASNSHTNGYFIAAEDGQVRAFSPAQSTNCDIEYSKQTPCWQNSGGQKIYVSISRQRLWACNGQSVAQTTPITTGKYSANGNSGTPTGNFSVKAKIRNTYLTGPGYRAHVDYWMPFHRGYGLHDASWRSSFGGSDFGRVGSHGCINMPPPQAEQLFHWVNVGTPVIVTG